MPRRSSCIVVIVSALVLGLVAAPAGAVRWDPVPPDQLALAQPQVEAADAEAIFWKVWVEDTYDATGLVSIRDHYVRIKVFSPKGAQDHATIDIYYPRRGVAVSDLDARTILPDGAVLTVPGKSMITEVAARKGREQLRKTSFAMPGLVPGAIIEYRYRERRWAAPTHYETFEFQREIPVQRVVYYVKPLAQPGVVMRRASFNVAIAEVSDQPGFTGLEARNQRAFVEEPFMPPERQARGWMMVNYTNRPAESTDAYWARMGREVAKSFDDDVKADDEIQAQARAVVAGASDDTDRVRRLIKWVHREFRVVPPDSLEHYGLRETRRARDAFRGRAGTRESANRVFASMARAAGLQAYAALGPSRHQVTFEPRSAEVGLLQCLRVAVRLDGAWRCLDPSAPHLPWDMLEWDEEGQLALVCTRDSSGFIETPIAPPERSVLGRSATLTLDESGVLEGELWVQTTGHLNATLRAALEQAGVAEADSVLGHEPVIKLDGIEVRVLRVEPGTSPRDPMRVHCRIRMADAATRTGKRLIVPIAPLQSRRSPFFQESRRRHPVSFHHAWVEHDTVRVILPPGWKPEAIEPPAPVEAEGIAQYRASVMVRDDGGEMIVHRSFDMGRHGSLAFPLRHYSGAKQLFDLVHQRDQATLTLVRSDDASAGAPR